ncbi:MAG: leucine-rich repeat domain-containing protein [Bacteroidales bacterium]|nr:leucine-rich repeat domain-containing protein [Bacteroidales bacterium]
MKKTTLLLKGRWRTALLVLLLSAAGMANVFADGYDYAEVCPSGQTLYYKIDPDDPNSVIVVPPYYYHFDGQSAPIYEFWGQGYEKPVGDVIIPETLSNGVVVKEIGYCILSGPMFLGAFQDCTEITSVTIGNSVIEIGGSDMYGGAFSGCTNLTSVVFGNAVTIFGARAFSGCTSLTSVTLPNSVTMINQRTFEGCTGLTSITIPNSVTSIGNRAFSGCRKLSSITIPNSLKTIGYEVFEGTEWYNSQSDGILYLDNWCIGWKGEMPSIGELVIREGTRGIADDAFGPGPKKNRSFTSVAFPQSLAFIGKGAFYGCSGLTSINLPNSLVAIGESAFEYCSGLTSVTIPKAVTEIERDAFYNCSRLFQVYYDAENATASNGVFKRCENLATLSIGPNVRSIDENVFKDCNTVHLVVALGSNPASLGTSAFSDIAENSMLMVPCGKRMTYFAAWNMFPYDNILENCDQFPISMGNIGAGGSITSSTSNAQMGEEVQLTIAPNAGMALESITISNANDPAQTIPYYFIGKANDKVGFVMPQFAVSVSATFKTSSASVGENDGVCVSIYPNPTNGQVKIEAEDLKQITISNMLGQRIYEGEAIGNVFAYDLGKHGAGLYLIRIETASGVAVKKVSVTQ